MADVILVPLDGSDRAEQALPYAVWLARTLNATVRLLYIAAPSDDEQADTLLPAAYAPALARTLRTSMGHYLDATAASLGAAGVPAQTALIVADPVRGLQAAAAAAEVRLVVLATHGRGGLRGLLLGSVAHALLRTCPRPVLVVAARGRAPVPTPVTLGRLVVPLDGSARAEAALPVAADLARAAWAPVTLVRVVPVLPRGVSAPFPGMRSHAEQEYHLCAEARVYLRDVRQRLPASLEVETLVVRGDAGAQLVAGRRADDLVVLTSHRRSDLGRALLGSVADRLLQAAVPVLVVPPAEEAESATAKVPPV